MRKGPPSECRLLITVVLDSQKGLAGEKEEASEGVSKGSGAPLQTGGGNLGCEWPVRVCLWDRPPINRGGPPRLSQLCRRPRKKCVRHTPHKFRKLGIAQCVGADTQVQGV